MRIDKYLSQKYGSRTKASEALSRGLVKVNGKPVPNSYEVREGDEITFSEPEESFVSNGGYKLSKALKDFGFCVEDKVFADIGASNGGFTDCLFQRGAKKVYCIDVGESQLDDSLKSRNVVIIDNFNARELRKDMFSEQLDGAVIDVSFISLTYILEGVSACLGEGAAVIALIKPQFELDGKGVGKNGIVRDKKAQERAIKRVYEFSLKCGLSPQKLTCAPVREGKNKEFPILLKKGGRVTEYDELVKYANL